MPGLLAFAGVTASTLPPHPIAGHPSMWIAPVIALVALVRVALAKSGSAALAGTSVFLLALMASAAQTIFPNLLPAIDACRRLNIYNSAPSAYSVSSAFTAALIGFGTALIYGTIAAVRLMRAR